jgi:hypothetical protein
MRPVIYQSNGSIDTGGYLMGHHRWGSRVSVARVHISAVRPLTGSVPTVFTMEVAGVLTGYTVTIYPQANLVTGLPFLVGATVAADSDIRWKCTSGPAEIEDCLSDVTLIMEPALVGELSAAAASAAMVVKWVYGEERLDLYRYDTGTFVFTEAVAGISSGRAVVAGGSNFSVTFAAGGLVMEADSSGLKLKKVCANGSCGNTSGPRLEFWIGQERVATLTATGELRVVQASEVSSLTVDSDRYVFEGGGVAKAVLGVGGVDLEATKLLEF